MLKLGKFYISLFIIPLIIVSYITDTQKSLFVSYATVILHELAHLIAALRLDISISGFVLMPFGAALRLKDRLIADPKRECLLCAAGPLCNLIFALLCAYILHFKMPLSSKYSEYINLFLYSNLSLLLINILPIIPLDGGRILRSLLTHICGFARAAKITLAVSQICIVLIGALSVYVLYVTRFNVSVMVLCAFLLFNISSERRNDTLTVMRQIIYSKEKLARRKIMNVKQIAVTEKTDARRLLKGFSYNCYYLVSIIDKHGNMVETLSETQIINRLAADNSAKKYFI